MGRVDEIQKLCRNVAKFFWFCFFDIEILHRNVKDFAVRTQVQFQAIKNKKYCKKKEIERRYDKLFALNNYVLKGWILQ